MTIPVLFLLGAFGLSFVLGVIVWLFSRPRKQKFGSSIDTFKGDLSALAPPVRRGQSRRHGGVHGSHARHANPRSQPHGAGSRPKPGPRPRS